MKRRKAQSALEFLTTYGWAFLVILIMIGALAYFGVLDPKRFLPDKCVMTAGINCGEYVINAGDPSQLQLRMTNNLGKTANVQNVNATVTGATCTLGTMTVNGISMPGTQSWPVGTEALFVVRCGANELNIGDRPTFEITITYQEAGGTFNKTVTGTVSSKAI